MARTAQGSGSIRKRPDGRWEARYTAGINPATGKQIRRSLYGQTQKEVREKLRKVTTEIDEGSYQAPNQLTLEIWLKVWLAEYIANVKPHTRKSYETISRNHIAPVLGRKRLQELSPIDIQKFINQLQNQADDTKPLSPKTIKNIHGVLHSALQQAMWIGAIRTNPADLTTLPKQVKKELVPLQDEQIGEFLKVIKGHRYEYVYLFDLFTGLRESELIGLKWEDVDFEHGAITIRRQLQFLGEKRGGYCFSTPKNNKSRLIAPAQYVMDVLRCQKRHQAELQIAAGPAWSNEDRLVFTDALDQHLKHVMLYKDLKKIFGQMGAPNLRFHDLRHAYAVMSIRAGDDIKTVQTNLGHYSAAFTLDVYGHVTEEMRRDSANRMDKFIRNISNG